MELTFNVKDEYIESMKEAYNNYVECVKNQDKEHIVKVTQTYKQACKTVLASIDEQLEDVVHEG